MADTLFSEKKYSTLDVEKYTNELEFMKQKVNTISRKGLNQFEGQSTGSKGWFKLDIDFFYSLKFIQNSIKQCFKIILKIKTRKYIEQFLHRLINN